MHRPRLTLEVARIARVRLPKPAFAIVSTVITHLLAGVPKASIHGGMDRGHLQRLSKDELIDMVLRLQRPEMTSKPPSTDRK